MPIVSATYVLICAVKKTNVCACLVFERLNRYYDIAFNGTNQAQMNSTHGVKVMSLSQIMFVISN